MSPQRLSEDELVNIERALLMDFNWADHVQAIAYCGSAKNEVIPGLLVTVRSLEAENVRLREAIELLDAECERRQEDVSELSAECERWHDEVASMDHARDCKGGRWYNGAGLCNCARSLLSEGERG